MKIYLKIFMGCLLLFLLTATTCASDDDFSCEAQFEALNDLKIVIEDLANESVCNETTECRTIAFGSKACGGPMTYLVYSTSIDIEELEEMVADYNRIEAAYNERCDIISDCRMVSEPTELDCIEGKCVIVN